MELKFKAKIFKDYYEQRKEVLDKIKGDWIYFTIDDLMDESINYLINTKTICVWTGMDDIEHNDIYEGDKVLDGKNIIEVVYSTNNYAPHDDFSIAGFNIGMLHGGCIIIGNKFD